MGATVKREPRCPPNLTADEKHTEFRGQKAYLTVVAAQGCILGSQLCKSVGYDALRQGYAVFKQEIGAHLAKYVPKSVTVDGWEATRQAWESLFPGIVWILCFLHEVIKVRDLCRSCRSLNQVLQEKLWQIYHGSNKREFAQRLRRFLEWLSSQQLRPSLELRLKRLRQKSAFFQRAYDWPEAPRTSNEVDRPMNYLDRTLFSMQYFHQYFGQNQTLI